MYLHYKTTIIKCNSNNLYLNYATNQGGNNDEKENYQNDDKDYWNTDC